MKQLLGCFVLCNAVTHYQDVYRDIATERGPSDELGQCAPLPLSVMTQTCNWGYYFPSA